MEQDAIQHLLTAYNLLCRTGLDRDRMAAGVAEMEKDSWSDRTIALSIVNGIHDGLAYGNWPSALEDIKAK